MNSGDTQEGMASQKTSTRTSLNGWRVVAASVCGTSHEKTGQACQDAHHWEMLSNGVLVAAVADGAGSAVLGGRGATVASQTAVEIVRSHLTTERLPESDEDWMVLLIHAITAAQKSVEAEALAHEVSPRDLATTLILVVASPNLISTVQVGDGATVASDGEDKIIAITTPQSGEYINETSFLTSPDAIETAQTKLWRGTVSHFAIFSDGLQMLGLKMPHGTPHTPFFFPLFRFVSNVTDQTVAKEQLITFLCSPRIRERADDDLTLLLAAFVE